MAERAPSWIETLKFGRINRTDFDFGKWPADQPEESVEKLSLAIVEEYRVRKNLPKNHPEYSLPLKWLKPVCYNAILTCLHHDLLESLYVRILAEKRLVRGPKTDRSIFMLGLIAIFAHDKPMVTTTGTGSKKVAATLTSEKERERLSEAMWWGFRHYIEPEELNAFNRKNPLNKITPKIKRESVLVAHYDTIVTRRASGELFGGDIEHFRGRYPDDLEEAVSAAVSKRCHERRIEPQRRDPDWD